MPFFKSRIYHKLKKTINKEYKTYGAQAYNRCLNLIHMEYKFKNITYNERQQLINYLGTLDNQNWWR